MDGYAVFPDHFLSLDCSLPPCKSEPVVRAPGSKHLSSAAGELTIGYKVFLVGAQMPPKCPCGEIYTVDFKIIPQQKECRLT